MRRYLVPLGKAENAVNTLQFSIDLASHVGAELYVTRIFPSQLQKKKLERVMKEDASDELKDILDQVDQKQVKIVAEPIPGYAEDTIERLAERVEANMIILSSTTAEKNDEYFLGKISGSLVKMTSFPILIIPPGKTFTGLKKALFAFKSGIISSESIKGSLKVLMENMEVEFQPLQILTPDLKEEDKVISTTLLRKSLPPKFVEADSANEGIATELQHNDYDILVVMRRPRGFFQKLLESTSIKKLEFNSEIPTLVLS